MKNLKTLLIFIVIFSSTINFSNSQIYAGISSIGTTTSCPGTILVPLYLTGQTWLMGFSLTIYYDATVLSAIQNVNTGAFVDNVNGGIGSANNITKAQTDFSIGEKQVKIGWNSITGAQLDTDSVGVAMICDLKFRYFGGSTALIFDNSYNSGQNCEYVGQGSIVFIDTSSSISFYVNGSVTQGTAPNQPGIITGPSSPCSGNNIFSVVNVPGVDYIWSNTCNFSDSSNINLISYLVDSNATLPGIISVYATNSCGIGPVSSLAILNSLDSSSSSSIFVSASINPVCSGISSLLISSGGSLGDGAKWYWYSGICGGVFEGTGSSFMVSPSLITSYFIRGEGICNTTACISITVSFDTSSIAANNAYATSYTICSGLTTTLGITGGILGTSANWFWYSNSCGGTNENIGTSIVVSPSINTVYYVRAEGSCNTTTCVSVIVLTDTYSNAAISATSTSSSICQGFTTTLGISGGNIGSGANWYWYSNSCGGTIEGNGTTIVVGPSINTIYYVRAEGVCNTTTCVSAIVLVLTPSDTVNSVTASSTNICLGSSVTLGITGGNLGSGASWFWYSNSCGGTIEGNGISLIKNPTVNTLYFVRAAGTCNTTICSSIVITVNSYSTSAISATASQNAICSGDSTTLGITGGSLGSDANWYWYKNTCGGTITGIGSSIIVSPTVNTTFYIRAAGSCNTTTCASIFISTSSSSSLATSIYANPNTICFGYSSTIGISGGSLGTNAIWRWYSNLCGGTNEGSGLSLVVSPSISTIYFVRAEGTCNTTTCKTISVSVNSISNAASAASSNPNSVCQGSSSTLGITGGNLGVGAIWRWYIFSCGNTIVGNGQNLIVSPTISTTYYVRAEGACNSTTCVSTVVSSNVNSTAALSANATISTICIGMNTTLGLTSGNLGTGANWNWYSNSCGGTNEGNGTTLIVSPSTTTIYYVRAEGTCNTTSCVFITVTVNSNSVAATSANTSSFSVCSGTSPTLSITGGTLGTSSTWVWYSGSCNGNNEGAGNYLIVTPSTTTSYYVRAEGLCNTTTCVNVTITVNDNSISATSATATQNTFCQGSSTVLGLTGGSLGTSALWAWYPGTCGGTTIGNGTSLTITPSISETYYVRAEGLCNTTPCVNITLTVNDSSVTANSVTATSTAVCSGLATTLGVSGGILGTSALWEWYSGTCGGTTIGNGASFTISPSISTTYYVRAEGLCNTTPCVNIAITVNDTSTAATSASALPSTICSTYNSVLNVNGGTLGTSATWNWYDSSCGTGAAGIGLSITVTPTVSTTYYVRAEGMCNSTTCVNIPVTVILISTPNTSITASSSTICIGSATTLGVNGGFLGDGAMWEWYSGTCGGITIGNGASFSVSPSISTTYYVRAEGICNTTPCVSIAITVNDSSIIATAATATSTVICSGMGTTLGITGGILGTSANWIWYSGICGGTYTGSGISLAVTPAISANYYVRAEGICNTTPCVNIIITVDDISIAATAITASSDTVCTGTSTTLGVTGGILGTMASWNWYSGSCGVNFVGPGLSIIVSPTITTTFFVRAEGTCNTTLCVSKTIGINYSSVLATAITGTDSICAGSSVTLGLSGGTLGTNANWYWYSGSCGLTFISSGLSIIANPSITTDYYLRVEGLCNTTACIGKSITVVPLPVPVTSSNSPVCYGDTLKLYCSGGISYLWSGPNSFTSILQNSESPSFTSPGMYYVTITGVFGCTSTDSVNASMQPLSSLTGILKYSGGNILSANATIELLKKEDTLFNFYDSTNYSSGYLFNNLLPGIYILKATIHGTQYPHILPSYFDSAYTWKTADTIIIPCNSNITKNIKMVEINTTQSGGTGLISGNIWYLIPGTKTIGEPVPGAEVILTQQPDDEPISYTQTDTSGFYEFDSIPNGNYQLVVEIAGFQLKTTYPISVTPFNLTFQHRNFVVDTSDTGRGIYRQGGTGIGLNPVSEFSIFVFPNPYKEIVNISYKLDKKSSVNIEIIDISGRKIETFVNSVQVEGDYSYSFNGKTEVPDSNVYFIKFVINNNIYLKKIIKLD